MKPVQRSRTWIARLVTETVVRRDAGPEPTLTYLRRVSETSLAFYVRSETLRQNPSFLAGIFFLGFLCTRNPNPGAIKPIFLVQKYQY
jgi:hypothetical protein